MVKKNLKTIMILSILLILSLAVVSAVGAFVPGTYARDAASMAAQGMGQDLVDLFFVVPLLVISLVFMLRGNRAAFLIYGGTVFYTLYSFIIYALGVHFNILFLMYCLTLGLSLYAFILVLLELSSMEVESWFGPKLPVRITGIYLILISVMFYVLWLKDVVPPLLKNSIPKSVSDYGLLVNPIHVIDMAIALPGLVIAAVLLMRKQRLGIILAPISLVFVIILAIALVGMVMMLKIKGVSDDTSIAGIFIILALLSIVQLLVFLKNLEMPIKN
jgi:hypothetical protein